MERERDSSKLYDNGLVVGRFQVFHKGHQEIVSSALALCERTLILIGSSQESLTEKNPLSYEERKGMISSVFKEEYESGTLLIEPLPDLGVGNVPAWGRYVLGRAREILPEGSILMVSGKEERRVNWFDGGDSRIAELYVPKTVAVSATDVRAMILNGDEAGWRAFTDPRIWDRFSSIRRAVEASAGSSGTASV